MKELQLMRIGILLRNILIAGIAVMFLADIYNMITGAAGTAVPYHQRAVNVAFHSAFGVFELIMIGIMIYFIRNHPTRRIRLFSLLFFHTVGVLVLPMATGNYSLMALWFPWPQTLLPFDRSTPTAVFIASLIIGFLVIPLITLLWGRRAFCGYICPLGGYYSETLGRLFTPKPGKLKLMQRITPPLMFGVMTAALVFIVAFPATLDPVRTIQKNLFFALSQVLYFTIGIPVIGARSYCTHVCPLGFELGWLQHRKNRWKAKRAM